MTGPRISIVFVHSCSNLSVVCCTCMDLLCEFTTTKVLPSTDNNIRTDKNFLQLSHCLMLRPSFEHLIEGVVPAFSASRAHHWHRSPQADTASDIMWLAGRNGGVY